MWNDWSRVTVNMTGLAFPSEVLNLCNMICRFFVWMRSGLVMTKSSMLALDPNSPLQRFHSTLRRVLADTQRLNPDFLFLL